MTNINIPVFTDQNKIDTLLNELKSKTNYIQEFVDEYNLLGFGKLKGNELASLFYETENFIIQKLTGESAAKLGNVPVDSKKLIEIIEKPIGLQNLLNRLERHKNDRTNIQYYNLSYYTIQDDLVIVCPKKSEEIKKFNTVFLQNENQVEIFNNIEELVGNLNKLKHLLGGYLSFDMIQTQIIKRDIPLKNQSNPNEFNFTINPAFIVQLQKK